VSFPLDRHVAVVDLGFGDAGKGTVVDWLCATRPVPAVIRFNGGAQAGHNVVTEDGRSHAFAQFGAGTLRGVPTHLSRFMVVDPLALTAEADHLRALGVPDPYGLLTIDADALVATPYHRLANQARELARGDARHGSCGMGVGETMAYALDRPADAVRAGDLVAPPALTRKLDRLRSYLESVLAAVGPVDLTARTPTVEECVSVFAMVAERVRLVDTVHLGRLLAEGACVFEGAQGVLLDEWRGFHPFTTWSTTTFDNAVELIGDDPYRLGVLRCFTTRHGVGPMVTEDAGLTSALIDPHNSTGPWQGTFRVGHFDAVAHQYAVEVCGGLDGIALTHVDIAERTPDLRMCRGYLTRDGVMRRIAPGPFRDLDYQATLTDRLGTAMPLLDLDAPTDWPAAVAAAVGAPVVMTSHGPTARDKMPQRSTMHVKRVTGETWREQLRGIAAGRGVPAGRKVRHRAQRNIAGTPDHGRR
jgi:adenylosuccinate synthase